MAEIFRRYSDGIVPNIKKFHQSSRVEPSRFHLISSSPSLPWNTWTSFFFPRWCHSASFVPKSFRLWCDLRIVLRETRHVKAEDGRHHRIDVGWATISGEISESNWLARQKESGRANAAFLQELQFTARCAIFCAYATWRGMKGAMKAEAECEKLLGLR